MSKITIIAGGPSSHKIDYNLIDGDILVVNRDQYLEFANFYIALDSDVLVAHAAKLAAWHGTVLTTKIQCVPYVCNISMIRTKFGHGFSVYPPYFVGYSTSYVAVQWALGKYEDITVIGVDQAPDDKGEIYKDGVYKNPAINDARRLERFKKEAEAFSRIPEQLYNKLTFVSDYNPWPWFERAGGISTNSFKNSLDVTNQMEVEDEQEEDFCQST